MVLARLQVRGHSGKHPPVGLSSWSSPLWRSPQSANLIGEQEKHFKYERSSLPAVTATDKRTTGWTNTLAAAEKKLLTIFLDVLTAAVDHPGHLAVNGIEAQPFVPVLLLFAWRLSWQGELQRLEQARLVVVQVGDGVHWHASLEVNNCFIQIQTPWRRSVAQSATNRVILPYPPACSGCRLGRVGRCRLIGCLWCGAQRGVAAG